MHSSLGSSLVISEIIFVHKLFVTFSQVDQLKMGDIVEVRGQSNEVWYAIIAESPIYGAIIAKKASKKRKISAPGANIIWLDQLNKKLPNVLTVTKLKDWIPFNAITKWGVGKAELDVNSGKFTIDLLR